MAKSENRHCDVLLVGFEAQENLGLRSIAAYLMREGIRVAIEPLQDATKDRILEGIRRRRPRVVGFSLIFQRMLDDFAELIAYLRKRRVTAHFTMGGHYPTFEHEQILMSLPGVDTVIRHEGEETLLELFRNLDRPESWSAIAGLAFRRNGGVHTTPRRPLISDLDTLPFPVRSPDGARHRGIGIRSLAGSRGCCYNCSFCSIREFYHGSPGSNRRTRSPESVVREMEMLFHDHGVRIFIFQDDDILMRARRHRDWLNDFLRRLEQAGLAKQILWRISCRVDDINGAMLRRMQAAGLASVYLGIEAGSDRGLKTFNKGYRVDDVHRSLDTLRRVGIPFEFGFMIFEPYSTMASVRENIDFLRRVGKTGEALVHFCKMSPYAGTPIAGRLKSEGRLEGTAACPDYRFLDGRLDFLQLFYSQTFNVRNFDDRGLVERLRFAKFDACVVRKFFPSRHDGEAYGEAVQQLIRESNESAIEIMSLAARFVEEREEEEDIARHWALLHELAEQEWAVERRISMALDLVMTEYGFEASHSLRHYQPMA
jgi:anaerobic magnesium-protoporphyrin IX monomethyl ester cyclase